MRYVIEAKSVHYALNRVLTERVFVRGGKVNFGAAEIMQHLIPRLALRYLKPGRPSKWTDCSLKQHSQMIE